MGLSWTSPLKILPNSDVFLLFHIQSQVLSSSFTLEYQIPVPVGLFILSSILSKNGQILPFSCNKRPNLHSCMQLFDAVRIFDTLEYFLLTANCVFAEFSLCVHFSPENQPPFSLKRVLLNEQNYYVVMGYYAKKVIIPFKTCIVQCAPKNEETWDAYLLLLYQFCTSFREDNLLITESLK